jgi:hypothetical protein
MIISKFGVAQLSHAMPHDIVNICALEFYIFGILGVELGFLSTLWLLEF